MNNYALLLNEATVLLSEFSKNLHRIVTLLVQVSEHDGFKAEHKNNRMSMLKELDERLAITGRPFMYWKDVLTKFPNLKQWHDPRKLCLAYDKEVLQERKEAKAKRKKPNGRTTAGTKEIRTMWKNTFSIALNKLYAQLEKGPIYNTDQLDELLFGGHKPLPDPFVD